MTRPIVPFLVTVALSCTAPREPPPPAAAPVPSPAPQRVAFVPTASASTTPPPPSPVPSGRYTCGESECASGRETCCEPELTCVKRGSETEACHVRHDCDVAADCAEGQSCCVHSYAMTAPYYTRRCEQGPCREAETCRLGDCPNGQTCRGFAHLDPRSLGLCANAGSSVACGEQRCVADQPWCSWDAKAETGQCVSSVTDSPTASFRCDDDTDCLADERCWLGTRSSWCCRGESCFDHAATTRYTPCKTKADCPKLEGMSFACLPDKGLLPSISRRCFPFYLEPKASR